MVSYPRLKPLRVILKRLAILGAWVLLSAEIMTCQPSQTATGKHQPVEQSHSSVSPGSDQNRQSNGQENQQEPGDDAPDRDFSVKWLAWVKDPNWWLVIAAGVTGVFVCWQSWETHKSAEATRKSVDLSAAANSQWVRLKLLGMYSEIEPQQPDPPPVITIKCRWAILNPSTQPLTLHRVKVDVARDDAWHVSVFDFDEVVPPGKDGKIVIVPILLSANETAEYRKDGVEYSIAIHVLFTGTNGRESSQSWGDLFYFCKDQVEWNASLGKGP